MGISVTLRGGSGDMSKVIYDPNLDGKIAPAELEENQFSTQNVVTASRAIDETVYQNTGNVPMFVVVTCVYNIGSPETEAYSDAANPPTTMVGRSDASGVGGGHNINLAFIVLPGNYYKVKSYQAALVAWVEWV